MKNIVITLALSLLIIACSKEPKGNMIVNGNVNGLKVGKLYLQQLQDSVLVNVDSVIINGESSFQMSTTIDEPQLMYLYLDKKDNSIYNDRLAFFAEDTIITINTSLDQFDTEAVVTGSKNQQLYNEFNKTNKQLIVRYTELVKRSMNLNQAEVKNQDSINTLSNDFDKHLKKKIGYVINFAMLHKNHEISPYLLMKEGLDANPVYLDSTYNMMSKKIQSSRYGKQLSEFIKDSKVNL